MRCWEKNRCLDDNSGFKNRSRAELLTTSTAGTSILIRAIRSRDLHYFSWRCDPLLWEYSMGSRYSLWTKGVASTKYTGHRLEGYSLLIRGVANPLDSGVFTLDQGCGKPT